MYNIIAYNNCWYCYVAIMETTKKQWRWSKLKINQRDVTKMYQTSCHDGLRELSHLFYNESAMRVCYGMFVDSDVKWHIKLYFEQATSDLLVIYSDHSVAY